MEDEIIDKDLALVENEEQIGELLKTKERTPEQEEQLAELKKQRSSLARERINELTKKQRQAELRAQQLEQELAEERRKKAEEREEVRFERPTSSNREQITIGTKKFYTDKALSAMVQAGEMSQDEAWQHQQERIEEKAVLRIKQEKVNEDIEKVKQDTFNEVHKEYPHFLDTRHPDHNPNDPLYREAKRIYDNGYQFNPRGLKLAIEDAKKSLGITSKRPDLSEELGVTQNGAGAPPERKAKTVELSEYEKDNAIRLYCLGGMTNPKTGRPYTQAEAIQKAMNAKTERQAALAVKR